MKVELWNIESVFNFMGNMLMVTIGFVSFMVIIPALIYLVLPLLHFFTDSIVGTYEIDKDPNWYTDLKKYIKNKKSGKTKE